MHRDVIIADGFYDDPRAVVRYAYRQEFISPYDGADADGGRVQSGWRSTRFRRAADCPFKSSEGLIERLEFLTGEALDREHWALDFPVDERGYLLPDVEAHRRGCWWNCSFHVKHYAHDPGDGVHNHTDKDIWNCVDEDGWVGLIYLNEDAPPSSGLYTWNNIDPAHQYDWTTPKENWILIDMFGNVFNRLILHRGRVPHSGAGGWGSSLQEGRLYQTFFFRTLGVRRVRPLAVSELGL